MRFEKVILVNPPSPAGYVANRDSMGGFGQLFAEDATILPPLDLVYLAGYLATKTVSLVVLEAEGLGLNAIELAERVAAASDSRPALVVVRTAAPTLDDDLAACALIKKAQSAVRIAMYGAVVSHVGKRLERDAVLDYVVQGEPDETVWDLASGRTESEIPGLSHRVDGKWVVNPPRPFEKRLDEIPFPKWELFPYQKYAIPQSSAAGDLPFLPMLTSRGCPFGCHYCPYPVGQGIPWRFRSPQNVVDEIEHLVKDLGIRYIVFRDPMFSMRLPRVVEICEEIRRRGLVFKWKCETRPDCLDEETVRAMASAGCEGINFGVESAEEKIQKNAGRKPISREKIIEMTSICRRYGIKTFCFFIIGLPGDTVETILETIDFAIRLNANWVQFTAATPFIGTQLRRWAVDRGLVTEDEYAYVSSHEATVGNENLTKQQVYALHRFAKLFERFLLNRGGILKDENRRGAVYAAARSAANVLSAVSARTLFAIGRARFAHVA